MAKYDTCDVESAVQLNTAVSLYTKGRHEADTRTTMPAICGCELQKSWSISFNSITQPEDSPLSTQLYISNVQL
jgi:hypothetical protein